MTSKGEQTVAFGLMVVTFILGIVCYTAFSHEPPEEPVRIVFKTTAGKVLFDHKTHVEDYGVACDDCHHEEQDGTSSCSGEDCHGPESDPSRGDALHTNCKGCHEEGGAGPVECAACHVLL